MRKRNKLLRDLIQNSDFPCGPFGPEQRPALEYWAAKGCIELTHAWGGDIASVSVTPKGITYFEDRRERFWIFVAKHLLSFIGGFASGVLATVAATLIVQKLL